MPYANPEDRKAQQRRYRAANLESIRTWHCKYRQEHRAERNAGKDRRRRAENPLNHRKTYFLKKYGLTEPEYDAFIIAHNNKCDICGTTDPHGRGDVFHVDHNHRTNVVRGLLCSSCNVALGHIEGDKFPLFIAYLKEHKSWPQ